MRPLDGYGFALHLGDGVIGTREIDRFSGKHLLHHVQSFFQTADSYARCIKWNACLRVIGWQLACPQAQLEASFRKQVQGRHLLGEQCRVSETITEHQAANSQRGSCLSSDGECRQWSNAYRNVIGD